MDDEEGTRRRGSPRLIDRYRIVDAARRLDPGSVTLQAVADELGVHRQSLAYHVADRDELLRLVALEELIASTCTVATAEGSDWADIARAFARALREAIVSLGELSRHIRADDADQLPFLGVVEDLLAALFFVGLDKRRAVATVNVVIDLCLTAGRAATDPVTIERERQAAHIENEVLSDAAFEQSSLRRSAAAHAMPDSSEQFEFALDLMVRGVASLIADTARSVRGGCADAAGEGPQ